MIFCESLVSADRLRKMGNLLLRGERANHFSSEFGESGAIEHLIVLVPIQSHFIVVRRGSLSSVSSLFYNLLARVLILSDLQSRIEFETTVAGWEASWNR